MSSDLTTLTNSAGIFSDGGVDDTINKDLNWVLTSGKVDNFEGSLDVSVGHGLLAGVASVHHEGVDETFNDWAGALFETDGVPLEAGVSGEVVVLEGDVPGEGWISASDVIDGPLIIKLNL